MNIDELTVGQIKQLQAAIGQQQATPGRATSVAPGRYVFVVDRGWIFAGDASVSADGYIRASDAVWVFRWESMGFSKMLEDWKNDKVDLRPCADVEIPSASIIFRVPVASDWGKK